MELDPDHDRAHLLLARALLELGREEEAIASLERSLLAAPRSEDPHYLLAQIYARQGNEERANQQIELYEEKKRVAKHREKD